MWNDHLEEAVLKSHLFISAPNKEDVSCTKLFAHLTYFKISVTYKEECHRQKLFSKWWWMRKNLQKAVPKSHLFFMSQAKRMTKVMHR